MPRMAHHTSTNSGTVATNMDRFNNFQSARPVGSSVWVLNQPYIILYKWKLVFIDLCPNYCCLYRLLGMELSARDNGSATTALQCRWRDSTSGAPDISQGGQLCMGDSHAWNTGANCQRKLNWIALWARRGTSGKKELFSSYFVNV